MMEAFSCTRTLGPIRVTAESPRKHDNLLFFLFKVVESRPRGPSIIALLFLLCIYLLCHDSLICLLAISPRVLGPLTSTLDPAFLLFDLSVPLSLSFARFRIKLCSLLLNSVLFPIPHEC